MKNIRQVISGLGFRSVACFSSLIPDNVVEFRNAENKPGWKMYKHIYIYTCITSMLTVFAGSLEGKGGNELWTKQGKEEGERDYGKYFGFDEKLIEREVIFLVRTTRFKWREGKKNRGRRKFGCGERSFGITAISPVVEPFLPYPRYYFPAPGQEVRLPSPFPRTKRFDGGRPIVSSTTVVGISSGLEDFRNAATL